MALQIVRLSHKGTGRWGLLQSSAPHTADESIQVELLSTDAVTTTELLANFDTNGELIGSGEIITVDARQLLSPVTTDASIVCQGLNYASHTAEAGHAERKANLFFMKASSAISGPYDDIVRPEGVELLDYELEIGLVLRRGFDSRVEVDAKNVGDYLGGVVLTNDISARDAMFGASFFQWFQGKSFRTFCPTGPVLYLMKPDEVAAIIDNLSISLERDGEVKQSANSSQQVFKAPETLNQLSGFMNLKPGDLIMTGTPGGVIAQGTPNIMGILKDNLLDDPTRRAELVKEFKTTDPFLQPGDRLHLTLRDETNDLDLGGQTSSIA